MTTPYENFVNIALGKSVSADVTLPTADDIPVFTGIGRQVTGKTIAELGLALSSDILQKDTVYIPNSTDPFPLETKTLYMIGDFITTTYGDLYLQLPPLTASTIIEVQLAFNIEQVGHVYLIPSGTDLVFGEGNPVDLKNLPLAPGCTIKLFFHSGSGWIGQANYSSDHQILPKIHPFNAASFGIGHYINSQATSGLSIQIPDANVNLGTLPSVATTDLNTLSGTRTRILGGSSNTVSGTDNIAIGCTSATLSGARQTAIGAKFNAAITCNNAIVLGSANDGYSVTIRHPLYKHPYETLLISRADGDYEYTTTLANSPKAVLTQGTFGAARHTLTFIATAFDATPAGIGSITGSRIFSVRYDGSAYSVSSIDTPVADSATGGLSITFAVSLITVSGIRVLEIVPTVTGGGVSSYTCYATLESLYMY
jgi:hypothetical protein